MSVSVVKGRGSGQHVPLPQRNLRKERRWEKEEVLHRVLTPASPTCSRLSQKGSRRGRNIRMGVKRRPKASLPAQTRQVTSLSRKSWF